MATKRLSRFGLWKWTLGFALFLPFLYALALLLLMTFENALVFRPATAAQEWRTPSAETRVKNVYFQSRDGYRIHGWWCPGEQTRGAVLMCHGNSHNISTIRAAHPHKLHQWHYQLGLSLLIFDYPGYGKSAGTPSESGCYATAESAYDWLIEEQHLRPEQIVLYGKSLGTAVAVDLASRRLHRALVLVSPFTSIPDVAEACYPLLPARWLMHNRFDCLAKIRQCRQPLLVFHGTHDRRVPFHLGKRLFDAATAPKRFLRVDGAHHGSSVVVDFFPELKRFLKDMKK